MHKRLKTLGFMSRNRHTVAAAIRREPANHGRGPVLCGFMLTLFLAGCGSDSNPFTGGGSTPPANGSPPTGSPPPGEPPADEDPPQGNPPADEEEDDPPPPPAPSTFSVTLSWQAPTERADGTPLTDLAGFRIYYGTAREDLDTVIDLTNPGLSRYVVENLTAGTWYFAMTAYDQAGLQSSPSPTVEARLN